MSAEFKGHSRVYVHALTIETQQTNCVFQSAQQSDAIKHN